MRYYLYSFFNPKNITVAYNKSVAEGLNKVYKCCECGRRTFSALDVSPPDNGRYFCNDSKACERRQREAKSFDPEIVNGVDCDGRIYGR